MASASGMSAVFSAWEPATIAAFTNPEILIGTGSYLLLKPLLKRSGLVDKTKGAYKTSVRRVHALAVVHGRRAGLELYQPTHEAPRHALATAAAAAAAAISFPDLVGRLEEHLPERLGPGLQREEVGRRSRALLGLLLCLDREQRPSVLKTARAGAASPGTREAPARSSSKECQSQAPKHLI